MILAVVIVAVIVLAVIIYLIRSAASSRPAPSAGEDTAFRLGPEVADFHVRNDAALVYFAVPVPAGEVDDVLGELLGNEALEVVREKRHSLPIDQVTTVIAFGTRDGENVEVARIELETPGELPPPAPASTAPHASRVGFDPLSTYSEELTSAPPPPVADAVREGDLASLGSEIRLAGAVEAGLRAQGVDPATMSAEDLAVGLLRLSGYALADGGKPDTFYATRAGTRTYLRIVPHAPGAYPELENQVVNEFMIDFVSSGADRGLLVSDKFCPFEVYERERREPRVRFVTRERLQGFVDALTVS